MTHFPHGAIIAAEQAKRRRLEEREEEQMTTYSNEDLEKDWEFKIVRNEYGIFRKPEKFQQLLEEESIAGWELVEKLDDRRVRFKRRHSARNNDHMLPPDIDPYRSRFGGASRPAMIAVVAVSLILALGAGVALLFAADTGVEPSAIWGTLTGIPLVITILIIGLLVAVKARR